MNGMWSKQMYGTSFFRRYEGDEAITLGDVEQEQDQFGNIRGHNYTATAWDGRKKINLGSFASRKDARNAVEAYWQNR